MGIFALALCFVLLYVVARRFTEDRGRAALTAALAWGCIVVGVSEFLGALTCLTTLGDLAGWASVDVALAIAMFWTKPAPDCRVSIAETWKVISGPAVVGVLLIIIATGLVGLCSAPDEWDSMIYHLSRVMHWMHDRSLAVYPTNCLAQLYQQPWAELTMLQFQLLTGGDRLAFVVQWASMVGCVLAAARVAGLLGGNVRAKVLAAVLVATLPAGVLQAESTQNNYAVAFWLICAVDAILELSKLSSRSLAMVGDAVKSRALPLHGGRLFDLAESVEAKPPLEKRSRGKISALGTSMRAGSAFGLAFLTKGTAGVFALPLLLWFAIISFRRSFVRGLLITATAGLLALAITAGHACRNWEWCGSPLMPATETTVYRVDAMSAPLLACNLIRNAALQLNTPSAGLNRSIEHVFRWLIRATGVDENDPRITFPGHRFELLLAGHEDVTAAPVHLALFMCACFLLVWAPSLWPQGRQDPAMLVCAVVLGFVAFCASVKWQPFHARLYLPLFVMAAAPTAVVFSNMSCRRLVGAVVLILFAIAVALIIFNPMHPLLGKRSILRHDRSAQYFLGRLDYFGDYSTAADLLQGCGGTIGVATEGDGWEYPLWVFLHDRSGVWPTIISTPASAESPQPSKDDLRRLCGIVVLEPRMLPTALAEPGSGWEIHRLKHLIVLTRSAGQR